MVQNTLALMVLGTIKPNVVPTQFAVDVHTSVDVTNAYPSDTFISEANSTTGIALVNIDPTNSLALSVTANNLNGTTASAGSMVLAPGHHISAVLSGLVPTLPTNFQGSFKIQAGSPTMLATAINVVNVGGAFVSSTIPSISTLCTQAIQARSVSSLDPIWGARGL